MQGAGGISAATRVQAGFMRSAQRGDRAYPSVRMLAWGADPTALLNLDHRARRSLLARPPKRRRVDAAVAISRARLIPVGHNSRHREGPTLPRPGRLRHAGAGDVLRRGAETRRDPLPDLSRGCSGSNVPPSLSVRAGCRVALDVRLGPAVVSRCHSPHHGRGNDAARPPAEPPARRWAASTNDYFSPASPATMRVDFSLPRHGSYGAIPPCDPDLSPSHSTSEQRT